MRALESECLDLNSCALLSTNSWVVLDGLLNFSNSQFPHLSDGVISVATLYRAVLRVKWDNQCEVLSTVSYSSHDHHSQHHLKNHHHPSRIDAGWRCLLFVSTSSLACQLFAGLWNIMWFSAAYCVVSVILTEEISSPINSFEVW